MAAEITTGKDEKYNASHPRYTELRKVLKDLCNNGEITTAKLYEESDVSQSAINQFINGRESKTRFDKVFIQLSTWYETYQRRLESEKEIPNGPGYIHTETSRKIEEVVTYAHMAPDIVKVYGISGAGKTETFKEYVRNNSGVCLATMTSVHATVKSSLVEIGKCLSVSNARNNHLLFDEICDALVVKRGLLIIDEAQHLRTSSIDQIRQLHDATGCGVVLAGNEQVYSNIKGNNNTAEFLAPLSSRAMMGIRLKKTLPGDAVKIANAWGINNDESIKIIIEISQRPGALRAVHKTIKYACMLSSNRIPQTKHIRAAYKRLTEES